MCTENNFGNNLTDLSESLKVVQDTVYSIRKKINLKAGHLENLSSQEQPVFEYFHGMLCSQNNLLEYILRIAKNAAEIKYIVQTQDLVQQTCGELRTLAGLKENPALK